MKKYEQMFILATDTEGDKENELVEKLKSVILEDGGEIIESTRWGKRKLAYEIRNHNDGIYWYHVFNAPPEVPAKLRRIVRITEGFIRDILIDLSYAQKAEERRKNYLKESEKRKATVKQELKENSDRQENDFKDFDESSDVKAKAENDSASEHEEEQPKDAE